jgi:hypothetical protein
VDENEVVEFAVVGEPGTELPVVKGNVATVLDTETGKGGMATVQHPEAQGGKVMAGIEEHLLVIASKRLDAHSVSMPCDEEIEHLPAARAAVDVITEKIEGVGRVRPQYIFHEAAQGPGAPVNIAYNETT